MLKMERENIWAIVYARSILAIFNYTSTYNILRLKIPAFKSEIFMQICQKYIFANILL